LALATGARANEFHIALESVDAVKIDGETRDYAGRFFCFRCGSSIFARTDRAPAEWRYWVSWRAYVRSSSSNEDI
jgi:hypothetical protein